MLFHIKLLCLSQQMLFAELVFLPVTANAHHVEFVYLSQQMLQPEWGAFPLPPRVSSNDRYTSNSKPTSPVKRAKHASGQPAFIPQCVYWMDVKSKWWTSCQSRQKSFHGHLYFTGYHLIILLIVYLKNIQEGLSIEDLVWWWTFY